MIFQMSTIISLIENCRCFTQLNQIKSQDNINY
uniref:Uncharacterized protein n=1 Tax=Musa acuminata subsp. malaccensis TaxID=214687 RepID=A0A804K0H9_MUSAM